METIELKKKAIVHFKYGISHDIYSEPVLSYAKLAVEALEKQIPLNSITDGSWRACKCGQLAHLTRAGNYCSNCGQKI